MLFQTQERMQERQEREEVEMFDARKFYQKVKRLTESFYPGALNTR